MTKQKITIYENNVVAGTGSLLHTSNGGGSYYVADCPAELGANSGESDAAYEAIDRAINAGLDSVTHAEYTWTWEIEDADEEEAQGKSAQDVIALIREAGAEDDRAVIQTLEDGAALAALGISDADQASVEEAHDMMTKAE